MNRIALGVAAVVAFAAVMPAHAQQPPQVPIPRGIFVKGQIPGQYLARDRLIGLPVHNASGQIIGDVEDLIIGPDNQVEGVVMGTGGFFGAGEKKVGVRLSALQISQKDGKTTITLPAATKEVLTVLEPFKRAEPRRTLMDRARDKAQELTDKTKDSAGPAYEQAKERARQAYQSAKEQAGPAYREAKEQAKQAYEKAREQAGPAYDEARRAAKEAYDKAMAAAREAYNKATEKPGETPPAKQ
jgi:uncharacterized protein YjbJ (UPF0337 family)